MPFLDRTLEIKSIIENQLQKKSYENSTISTTTNSNTNSTTFNKKKQNNSSEFNTKAQQISKELQETADLLQKLTKLIKQRSPFDDNSELIKSLTLKVKDKLTTEDYSLRQLSQLINNPSHSSHSSSHSLNDKQQSQLQQHSSTIINGLNSKLMYTTEQFQSLLKLRTNQMKNDKKRRNLYTFDTTVRSISNITVNGNNNIAASPNKVINNNNNINMAVGSDNHKEEEEALIKNDQLDYNNNSNNSNLQLQEQLPIMSTNNNMLINRTDDILSIENEITKLSGMFNQLAILIKQQGELTQRIDHNLNIAADNIEKGNNELWKLWDSRKGNTGLILKMFGVLIIFIIIVGLFVVR
ncbi:hypothetical protein ABK040_010609 [Willaertia magna]